MHKNRETLIAFFLAALALTPTPAQCGPEIGYGLTRIALAGEENGVAHLVAYAPETRGMEDLGAIGPSVWSQLVYQAGAMVAHPSGRIFIGEAERISALVIYDPVKAAQEKANKLREATK